MTLYPFIGFLICVLHDGLYEAEVVLFLTKLSVVIDCSGVSMCEYMWVLFPSGLISGCYAALCLGHKGLGGGVVGKAGDEGYRDVFDRFSLFICLLLLLYV